MRKIFNQYPSIIYQLLLLFTLNAAAFACIYSEIDQISYYASDEKLEIYGFLAANFFLLLGIIYIISGWIADRINNIKNALFISVAATFLGGIIFCFESFPMVLLGTILVIGGTAIFTILIYLHLAIYFPFANDLKENVFMFSGLFAAIIGSIVGVGLGVFGGNFLISFIGICFFLFFLLILFKDLGYEILTQDDNEEEEKPSLFSLFFCTTLGILLMLSSFFLPAIASGTKSVLNLFTTEYYYFLQFIPIIIGIIAIRQILLYSKNHPRQIKKLIWGFTIIFVLGLSEFVVKISESYELDLLSDNLTSYVGTLLILPVLISTLTHNNYEKNAGFWLGIMLGVPTLAFYGAIKIFFIFDSLPYIIMLLLIASIIWLRENKDFLMEKLKLKEANQDFEEGEEEEKGEDPYDHLILNK